MTGQELEELMSQAAMATTGRNVTVKLQEPALDYASAETSKTLDGRAFVKLNPAGNYENLWESYCHEVAHILLDWSNIRPSNTHLAQARSETKSPMIRKIVRNLPFEQRAEQVGKAIADYGRKKSYDVYTSCEDPVIVGYLKALIKYPRLKGLVTK